MRSRVAVVCVIVVVVTAAFVERWRVLSSSPEPVGVDGYYYALQMRGLLAHGALPIPDRPLAFFLFAPFCAAFGVVAGLKLAAALFGAATAVAAYFAARASTPAPAGREGAVLAAVIAAASAGSFFLGAGLLKNAVAVALAYSFFALLPRALAVGEHRRRLRWIVACCTTFIAAALTHALGVALCVAGGAPAVLSWLSSSSSSTTSSSSSRPPPSPRVRVFLAIAIAAVVVALVFSFARHAAPGTATHGLAGARAFGFEGPLALAAAIRWALECARRRKRPDGVVAGMALLAFFTGLPFVDVITGDDLGQRLRAIAFVPLSLLAAELLRGLPPMRARALAFVAAIAFVATRPARGDSIAFAVPAMVDDVRALSGRLPPDAVIVCPVREVMFMASWFTGADARLDGDDVPGARRYLLLTKGAIVRAGGADYIASLGARAAWLPRHELLLVKPPA